MNLTYYNLLYDIGFEVAAIPMDLIIFFFIELRYKDKDEINKYFKRLIMAVITATIMDVLTAIVTSMTYRVANPVHILFNTLDCLLAVVSSVYFMMYCVTYVGQNYRKIKAYNLNIVLKIIYTFLLIQNFFTGTVFSYSQKGEYIHGPLFTLVAYLFPLYFILFGLIYLFSLKHDFMKWQIISFLSGVFFVIILYLVQMIFMQKTLMTYYGASIGVLLIVLTFETPDYTALIKTMEELKKSQDKVKEESDKAKKAADSKNRFLSQMSHEIRTPLNIILGYDDLILKNTNDTSSKEYAEKIKTAAAGLQEFFTSVMDYVSDDSKSDEVKEPPSVEVFKKMTDKRNNVKKTQSIFANLRVKEGEEKKHVLIVDDNDMNVDLLSRMIEPSGVLIDTEVNGKDAVDTLRHKKYDLVFMDHMMPVMDGMEAIQIIKATHICDDTPFIMMTANGLENDEEKYLKAGFSDYVTKPFQENRIYTILKKFLGLVETEPKSSVGNVRDIWSIVSDYFSFLDISYPKRYFLDNEEYYIEVLSEFANEDISEGMREALSKNSLYKYGCLVSSLSENAALIGATELMTLSKNAKKLSDENDIEALTAINTQIITIYQGQMSRIKEGLSRLALELNRGNP